MPNPTKTVEFLGGALGIIAFIVAAVLAFADKADATDLRDTNVRVRESERRLERIEVGSRWRDAAVYEIAQKVGAIVPPPPNP
jgi:hypothetical protein